MIKSTHCDKVYRYFTKVKYAENNVDEASSSYVLEIDTVQVSGFSNFTMTIYVCECSMFIWFLVTCHCVIGVMGCRTVHVSIDIDY